MKKRSIKFSLMYRDMFQSSGKYQPRKDQLERVASAIVEMGCFAWLVLTRALKHVSVHETKLD